MLAIESECPIQTAPRSPTPLVLRYILSRVEGLSKDAMCNQATSQPPLDLPLSAVAPSLPRHQ
jgi:hypothetical protein